MWMTGDYIKVEIKGLHVKYFSFVTLSLFLVVCTDGLLFFHINHVFPNPPPVQVTDRKYKMSFVFTSSITMSSLSVSARSWECSLMTCKTLVIMFSVSSVLPEDSLSKALRKGKQKEKAGAERGTTSKEKRQHKETREQSVCQH